MNRIRTIAAAAGVAGALGAVMAAAPPNWSATLSGFSEVPTLSTSAAGNFSASINGDGSVSWEFSYDVTNTVTQAHLHLGRTAVNGGVSVFLCTNLGNGPAGTQPCPQGSARITGIFTAADVVGPAAQGIAAGELEEVIAAIRAGAIYANLHTTTYPTGEIRGQLELGHRHAP